MNLDLAIQNTLKRSPMEGAMHGVLSNFGAQYELRSYTENAQLADQLFGDAVAVTAPVGDSQLSKAVIPDTGTFAPAAQQSFTQTVTLNGARYIISYSTAGNNYTLSQIQEANGLDRLVNWFKSGGKTQEATTVLLTKYGGDSGHRFLTAIEESTLQDNLKNAVISQVLTNMSPEITAVIQVRGVKKLKSDHFMGDAIVPSPLSHLHSGMLRNAEGFNQNPVGQHIAPPTKLAGAPRKNSRSL